jgi:hypothetical protein
VGSAKKRSKKKQKKRGGWVLLDGFCTCTWALIFFFQRPSDTGLSAAHLGLCCVIQRTTGPAAFSEKVDKKNGIFAASCPHTPNTTSLGCTQKIASAPLVACGLLWFPGGPWLVPRGL